MQFINSMIATPLGFLMKLCYDIFKNYGVAIIAFTILSKIILLPVSIWVQKNSIKMVKMQPDINRIKVKYFGDKDRIADEQARIFKREKYNPFASIIPLAIQILLLMGLIEVIYHPFNFLLNLPQDIINRLALITSNLTGIDASMSSIQLTTIELIKNPQHIASFTTLESQIPNISNYINQIQSLNMMFLGFDISWVPNVMKSFVILIPILAGISAWWLCDVQNKANVLQAEQSNLNKYGMMAFSVALSLYLGWFVPVGVGLYWIFSNVFAVIQLWLLNIIINPKDYVDYEALEASKKKLEELNKIGPTRKWLKKDANSKREKVDYKRFFSIANKHLVFYSESSGFYKYYKGIIQEILRISNVNIHYITSDPNDAIFKLAEGQSKIKPYYIGEKRLITLMMKMDADIVVMTMPDLDNFHIKKSLVRKDIKYIYIPHGMDSLNLTMRKGSVNNYDTVFCIGPHQKEEIRKTEQAYNLKEKNIVEWGYGLLDDMIEDYKNIEHNQIQEKNILIAPSWQDDNIVESCLEELLDNLSKSSYNIIVRPHPQHVKHYPEQMDKLKQKYLPNKNISIQTDFSSNSTVFEADLMVTDWSGIAYEFAYTTLKPVLFINTPMKVMNPEYEKIDIIPINVLLRDEIGCSLDIDQLDNINFTIEKMLKTDTIYEKKISEFVNKYVYNLGKSNIIGAKYILNLLTNKKI